MSYEIKYDALTPVENDDISEFSLWNIKHHT